MGFRKRRRLAARIAATAWARSSGESSAGSVVKSGIGVAMRLPRSRAAAIARELSTW
jgi:hypothetical protein